MHSSSLLESSLSVFTYGTSSPLSPESSDDTFNLRFTFLPRNLLFFFLHFLITGLVFFSLDVLFSFVRLSFFVALSFLI